MFTLKDMGYTNVLNLGGFKGWVDAGGETEREKKARAKERKLARSTRP